LDVEDDPSLSEAIRGTLEDDLHARIADIHYGVWARAIAA
jgi:hypothetical protein